MNNKQSLPILLISGPTASGKTALVFKLAENENIEVISADSRQVYKYMDIGTAKPSAKERAVCPHHLVDFLEPGADYSAGMFEKDANACIRDILARGKRPVVVGGSGLYIRALTDGLSELPDVSPELRAFLRKELTEKGAAEMYRQLSEADPAAAGEIPPENGNRILRALEIWKETGASITVLRERYRKEPEFEFHHVHVDLPRNVLYERINARVVDMVKAGLFDEVKALLDKGYSKDLNALNTVGYKESIKYLKGEWDRKTAVEKIQQNTRNFAKRQITWFRRVAIDVRGEPGKIMEEVNR